VGEETPAPRGRLIVISGPSGVGKGTVVDELRRRRPGLGLSLSWTTRPRRATEVDGVHYRFVDEDTFRTAAAEGAFVEWEEYRDALYGTPWTEVQRALDAGEDIVLEIDVRGAQTIKRRFPEAITIFLDPPSMEVLEERLRGRGTDQPEQIAARLEAAREELGSRDTLDEIVPSVEVAETVDRIEAIIGPAYPHRDTIRTDRAERRE
jgi:guanylate kinase